MSSETDKEVVDQLKKIVELLTPKPPPPTPPPPKGIWQEFRAFLGKGGVLALAVGFIMGTYIGKVVSALVSDIILPIPGALEPSGNWTSAQIVVPVAHGIHFLVGDFVNAIVTFLIVAVVVFFIARYANKIGVK
jgi:large conductance mechanosensitive channel